MSMARGGGMGGGGGAGGSSFAGAAAGGFAAAAAIAYASTQQGRGPGHSHGEGQGCGADVDEKKNKTKCRNFCLFSVTLMFGCWCIIQGWIESQHGMFEFIGIDAAPEEYRKRVISLYEQYNPEKLEGEKHRRPVDTLLWKYRYKEKQLWQKISKKYLDPKYQEKKDAKIAAEKEEERLRKEKLATLQDDADDEEEIKTEENTVEGDTGTGASKKEL